jgi:ribosomal protein S18 acetylase RimI-like enzyme
VTPSIAAIEAVAVRAMPAPATARIAGWQAAAGLGAMARVNSVTTFGIVPLDLAVAVASVERWYRERGLPPVFRPTDLDDRLDAFLDRLGYSRGVEVIVMTAPAAAPAAGPAPLDAAEFLAAHASFTGEPPLRTDELGLVIGRLTLPHLLAGRRASGGPVAVGRVVVDGALAGLFDLAVDPAHRRQGHGAALTAGLAGWAATRGADWTFLQVTTANAPALALYESLGFSERYRYHTRIAPISA